MRVPKLDVNGTPTTCIKVDAAKTRTIDMRARMLGRQLDSQASTRVGNKGICGAFWAGTLGHSGEPA
ncbi:hypothetical protein GOEFS_081_00480 [Gordonia effusa NBRC 100432]|uniref:Uncharacterized protein n=1 Tax=Gordonia effusa NBRC 100432 TaxID=1077974 RepID=H0R2Q7_9ACTN|nr:hypothetical protein GOEFS_081_00480 [Gordonia effusa NBRC 100432]